jgi:hypothetical protein
MLIQSFDMAKVNEQVQGRRGRSSVPSGVTAIALHMTSRYKRNERFIWKHGHAQIYNETTRSHGKKCNTKKNQIFTEEEKPKNSGRDRQAYSRHKVRERERKEDHPLNASQ